MQRPLQDWFYDARRRAEKDIGSVWQEGQSCTPYEPKKILTLVHRFKALCCLGLRGLREANKRKGGTMPSRLINQKFL